jgi:cation diffusion facilitator CzcD-associated flavoprotein CzcO
VVSRPARDAIADKLRAKLPAKTAYSIVRWKNVLLTMLSFQISRKRPQVMKNLIRKGLEAQLPAGFDIDTHFTPRYNPWTQRLCLVPDGDLFKSLSAGTSSIVTGHIETFTEKGIRLTDGSELEADIIVTATGLQMLALGGMEVSVDGAPVKFSETVGYKGIMFSGVPNLAACIGYTNASWTLKCDLACEYVCRLLNHMRDHGYREVMARWAEPELPKQPFIDLESGYVLRSIDDFPKQAQREPWRLYQNYVRDILMLRRAPLEDEALVFSRGSGTAPAAAEERVPA